MRLWIGYLTVGVLLAFVCDRRLREGSRVERLGSALLSVCAWPLYAPLVLLPERAAAALEESTLSRRIKAALSEARVAVAGTALQDILPEVLLTQLASSLGEVEQRRSELAALLARPELQRVPSSGAERHHGGLARLRALYQRDQAMLQELLELAESLRMQLLVAHYSARSDALGSNPKAAHGITPQSRLGAGPSWPQTEDVRGLALELTARVEALNAWFDLDLDSAPRSADTDASV
jgi:hypothetical protein